MISKITMRLVIGMAILSILRPAPACAMATPHDEIHTLTDKFWNDYAAGLKRIVDQKDDHAAALLCSQLRKDLKPRYDQLKQRSADWKKSHTQKEWLDLVDWTQKNAHFAEAMKLRMRPEMLMRGAQNKEFFEAYGAMIHDLPADANTTL